MSAYSYQSFGKLGDLDNLVALVPVIYSKGGRTSPVIWAEVDTGAAVSVAPKGLARDLRLDILAGRPVNLLGVGHGRVGSFVHLLDLQVSGFIFSNIPVAIVQDDTVPVLLGRLGLLSSAAIRLDPGTRSVQFSPSAMGT